MYYKKYSPVSFCLAAVGRQKVNGVHAAVTSTLFVGLERR